MTQCVEVAPVEGGKGSGLSGFLVVALCSMDDVPLFLCGSYEEATAFARGVKEGDSERAVAHVFGREATEFYGVEVVEFRDGRSLSYGESMRSRDEEAARP
jgi:hypothetical protein